MKKVLYIFLACMLFSSAVLKAQQVTISDPDRKWTVPAIYAMDEQVTWYFDFASAPQVADGEDLYMWIWAPVNPTGAPIPLNYEGNMVWSISFTPTVFFGMTVKELFDNKDNFYFLIRDLDATKLTGTLSFPKTDFIGDFANSNKVMDYAPSDFQLGGTLTILFNSNLVEGFNPVPSTVHMHGGLNDWAALQSFDAWLPDIREKTMFKYMGNGIYKKDLVPQTYFNVSEDYEMENVVFVIAKYNGDDAHPDWAGTAPDMKIIAPDAPIPPDPVFYFFPQKFSQYDMLTLVRTNNEKGTQGLTYTIKAGTKTLTGSFSGSLKEMRAYVDLLGGTSGAGPLTKISLEIHELKGREIVKTDIPLVPASELE